MPPNRPLNRSSPRRAMDSKLTIRAGGNIIG
jgi:hypothetical protein